MSILNILGSISCWLHYGPGWPIIQLIWSIGHWITIGDNKWLLNQSQFQFNRSLEFFPWTRIRFEVGRVLLYLWDWKRLKTQNWIFSKTKFRSSSNKVETFDRLTLPLVPSAVAKYVKASFKLKCELSNKSSFYPHALFLNVLKLLVAILDEVCKMRPLRRPFIASDVMTIFHKKSSRKSTTELCSS